MGGLSAGIRRPAGPRRRRRPDQQPRDRRSPVAARSGAVGGRDVPARRAAGNGRGRGVGGVPTPRQRCRLHRQSEPGGTAPRPNPPPRLRAGPGGGRPDRRRAEDPSPGRAGGSGERAGGLLLRRNLRRTGAGGVPRHGRRALHGGDAGRRCGGAPRHRENRGNGGRMNDRVCDVAGKVVVLTGACGLIGTTIARAFAGRGARMALVDVPPKDPEAFAAELGGEALGVVCDVSDVAAVRGLVDRVVERFGTIDVLINNHHFLAAGAWGSGAETFPDEAWESILRVNLTGTFIMCREVGKVMLEQGKGNIVNLASTYGVVSSNPALYEDNSLASPIAYSASKGG
ncbi:MAG TPA: SDR family NAD(P)-dependent oxidoreductase, partial [Acidobacteria bacterium]|nr:SDR family NAD(P)-dependent oxidoreductase [Acidobacteriota bacterium]